MFAMFTCSEPDFQLISLFYNKHKIYHTFNNRANNVKFHWNSGLYSHPLDTWRNDDIIITRKRRHDIVLA